MPRNQIISALFVVALSIGGAAYTATSGNEPLLGLDLQGGVSVVLQPTGPADDEALDQTLEIIRTRVDGLGVAEPEISRQGETIVVDLPGVEEQQRALELLGQTAELRFRPVITSLPSVPELNPDALPDQADAGQPETDSDSADFDSEDFGEQPESEEDSEGAPEPEPEAEEPADAEATDVEEGLGSTGQIVPAAFAQDTPESTPGPIITEPAPGPLITADEVPADGAEEPDEEEVDGEEAPAQGETPAVPPGEGEAADPSQQPLTPELQAAFEACNVEGTTDPEDDNAEDFVVLDSEEGGRLCLGPTLLTGTALETANASPGLMGDQWSVNPVFKSGAEGIDAFNNVAAQCFGREDTCPSSSLAIVLDHEVISAPTINSANFGRDQIEISGSFDEVSAENLALVLRFGSLPVELEPQQTRTVSAIIGDDVLRSGSVAGLAGLAIVAVYLLLYYRLAGLVALMGLGISAGLLWTVVAWFGEKQGLAVTLAGIVGLIVSIGVSADSNIVYFENVKDAIRDGRRVATAIERAYETSISTIVKADVVSLIAAVLLYFLTVGAVRGFAFYLGLATLLDLLISVFFMKPALQFLSKLGPVKRRPTLLGIPTGAKQ